MGVEHLWICSTTVQDRRANQFFGEEKRSETLQYVQKIEKQNCENSYHIDSLLHYTVRFDFVGVFLES